MREAGGVLPSPCPGPAGPAPHAGAPSPSPFGSKASGPWELDVWLIPPQRAATTTASGGSESLFQLNLVSRPSCLLCPLVSPPAFQGLRSRLAHLRPHLLSGERGYLECIFRPNTSTRFFSTMSGSRCSCDASAGVLINPGAGSAPVPRCISAVSALGNRGPLLHGDLRRDLSQRPQGALAAWAAIVGGRRVTVSPTAQTPCLPNKPLGSLRRPVLRAWGPPGLTVLGGLLPRQASPTSFLQSPRCPCILPRTPAPWPRPESMDRATSLCFLVCDAFVLQQSWVVTI